MLLLDYLRSTELYQRLAANDECGPEGNLLQITDDRTSEAQISFLIWAFSLADPSTVLEVGANRCMFGYLLSVTRPDAYLLTFDLNPATKKNAKLLHDSGLDIDIRIGDSLETLSSIVPNENYPQFGFAWIDGCHDYERAYSDLMNCSRLNIPYVAIDDTNYASVQQAIGTWLQTEPYAEIPNPFIGSDSRLARLYKRS